MGRVMARCLQRSPHQAQIKRVRALILCLTVPLRYICDKLGVHLKKFRNRNNVIPQEMKYIPVCFESKLASVCRCEVQNTCWRATAPTRAEICLSYLSRIGLLMQIRSFITQACRSCDAMRNMS